MDTAFQELLCKAFGVDDEEELPKAMQEIDVVKFAEFTPDQTKSTLTAALNCHLPAGAQPTAAAIVEATLSAIADAKVSAEVAGAVWPATAKATETAKGGDGATKPTFAVEEPEERDAAAAKKYMTGKYDFKLMRRLTAIENKFLEQLSGLYGVDDEDDLPSEIQDISLSEMFDSGETIDVIRAKVEKQLALKPWEGMDDAAATKVVGELAGALGPLLASVQSSIDEAKRRSYTGGEGTEEA